MISNGSGFHVQMKPRKIALCLFNRATYGRCKTVISELERYPNIDLTVLLSGSLMDEEYGNASSYIVQNHPKAKFVTLTYENGGATHLDACLDAANILRQFAIYFRAASPDAVIVIADRFETLPAAMAASYQNIPVYHIQGGEITGNIDDKVRHAVSMLADQHFVCTDLAKDYLREMGQEYYSIHKVGCPSTDLIKQIKAKRPTYLKDKYILCMFHPETENPDEAYTQTQTVLEAVLDYCRWVKPDHFRCLLYYPNPDPGRMPIVELMNKYRQEHKGIFIEADNQEPEEFYYRLAKARLIIGNSSCTIRESSVLGVPAINVGDRQRYRERGYNVIDLGYDKEAIFEALKRQHAAERYPFSQSPYGLKGAGRRIAEVVALLDPEIKGPLTYPTTGKYKAKHFGENRFNDRTTKPRNPEEEQDSDELGDSSGQREALSS